MRYLNCVLVLASVVPYGDYSGLLALLKKEMVMLSLLCVIFAWVYWIKWW
jgi:hypothetical protein